MIEPIQRGSKAVECIEDAWRLIQRIQPCVPSVVIVILAAGDRRNMGHFSPCIWKSKDDIGAHEVAINPVLFENPEDLLHVLLHEAAHALLQEWGLRGGCGPDGYYHREEFRNVVIKLGLSCQFHNKRYGWELTSWPTGGMPTCYAGVVDLLQQQIPAGLKGIIGPRVRTRRFRDEPQRVPD
jgi:hypothetical protein